MAVDPVSEKEIEAAESLRTSGEYGEALEMIQTLLGCAADDGTRMRLLFNAVYCSAGLDRPEQVNAAMLELEKLPQSEVSRVLADLGRAWAETSHGRPQNALNILDLDLATGLFESEDMKVHKYQLFLYKGEALLHLRRATEALEWLDRAHDLFPTIDSTTSVEESEIFCWVEPSIQIKRANCLLSLDRFEDSYRAAETVTSFENLELATSALQYMAECRLWQNRPEDALQIYVDLKKRLPCRLVDEQRIETGMANCISRIEKRRGLGKPS